MEEESEDWSPFWVQNTTDLRRADRFRHRVASVFFSSGLLIILLLVTAVFFLVFVVPSTLSFSAQIFRVSNVKKSWDSINIVLVLFALVFGFLSRNRNEDNSSSRFDDYQSRNEIKRSNPSTPRQWYGYSPRESRKSNPSTPHEWHGYMDSSNSNGGGLKRTYSSYPDLRGWSTGLAYSDDAWRFYDDTIVETYRRSDSGGSVQLLRRRSWKEVEQLQDSQQLEIKNVVHVDRFVNRLIEDSPADPPPPPSPPPAELAPSPPPPAFPEAPPPPADTPSAPPAAELRKIEEQHPRRTSQSGAHKRERRSKKRENEVVDDNPVESPRTPPPPPPLPPPPASHFLEQKSSKSDKKRGGGSATKEFLNSFYHKKKKKKQRQKSVENMDSLLNQPQPPAIRFQIPPPSPPPPPPPPPSVFHNLFTSKKDKRKRTEKGVIKAPIPAPAPPSQPLISAARAPKPSYQTAPISTKKPSRLAQVRSFENGDDNPNSGGESPLMARSIPPPPPPPPPFYKPAWKFVVQGDYVRMDSISSESPDPSDVDSDVTPTAAAGGGGAPLFPPSPLFCPSPDVNTKAERFISKFRAGLKLEKMNSMKKQQELGLSNLGPNPGPSNI